MLNKLIPLVGEYNLVDSRNKQLSQDAMKQDRLYRRRNENRD